MKLFCWFSLSLLLGTLITLCPLPSSITSFRPAWLLLVTIYWINRSPEYIGIGMAWIIGLWLDVLQNTLLGENALCFVVIAYITIKMQRQSYHTASRLTFSNVLLLIVVNQLLIAILEMLQHQIIWLSLWINLLTSSLAWWLIVLILPKRHLD